MLGHLQETHELNGRPSNLFPMAFKLSSSETSVKELEKQVLKLGMKRINYVACVDQIYDEKMFPALVQSLKLISLINKTLWERNGCLEELTLPTILMSHSLKKADLIERFLTLAKE